MSYNVKPSVVETREVLGAWNRSMGKKLFEWKGRGNPDVDPFNNISIIMGSLAKQRRPTGRMFGEGFLLVIYAMINGRIYVLYNCLFFEES